MRHAVGIVIMAAVVLALSTFASLADCGCSTGGQRIGAICKDGTTSKSTGSGTCSHHGGVAQWLTAPFSRLVVSAGANVKLTSVTPVVLRATATGSATPYTYTWNPGGTKAPDLTVALPGTYTVTVKDANGCPCSDSVEVTADRGAMAGGASGSWYVKMEAPSGAGSRTISLLLFAKEGRGTLGERVALALTCRGGVAGVAIGWWTVLGSTASVTWGFDDAPEVTATWPLSVEKTATTYPLNSMEFIQRLLRAKSFVARTPHSGQFITAVFDPVGLANVVQPLCEACGWPHYVETPGAPVGPTSGTAGQLLQFSVRRAACTHGHPVELSIDWGNGTVSEWAQTESWGKSWATDGVYSVRVRARCGADPSLVSDWSEPLGVTIGQPK